MSLLVDTSRVGGLCGNATVVHPTSAHHHVTFHTPTSSPAKKDSALIHNYKSFTCSSQASTPLPHKYHIQQQGHHGLAWWKSKLDCSTHLDGTTDAKDCIYSKVDFKRSCLLGSLNGQHQWQWKLDQLKQQLLLELLHHHEEYPCSPCP